MSDYIEQIKNGQDVRANLISVKQLIKDEKQKRALAYELAGDFSVFIGLLKEEDPKIRKNAVLILGEMECDDLCEIIWKSYEQEQTLFVKADYLKSLSHCDCRKLVPQMQKRLDQLTGMEILPEEEKHLRSEISALQSLILKYGKVKHHRFIGFQEPQDVILMVNRNHRGITAEQIPDQEIKMLSGGLKFRTTHLEEIMKIRTYSELLYSLPGKTVLEGSPDYMAKQLVRSGFLSFLDANHEGDGPYYFRLEVRSSLNQEQKVDLVKKMSIAIEKESCRRLVNTTSGYELEIRLIANKTGRFVPLVKLFTIPDRRFSYRREVLPTSIAPVNAALIMALSKEYLKENAQVLDPFCGTGTMLIERSRLTPCGSMYGLDILEEAVVKARKNTEAAQLMVNYINRNYFDFKHDYLFDEIVTNMPGIGKNREQREIRDLYDRFLRKSMEILKQNAVMVVYTTLPQVLREGLMTYPQYHILKEAVINEREDSYLFVIEYNQMI